MHQKQMDELLVSLPMGRDGGSLVKMDELGGLRDGRTRGERVGLMLGG